MQVGALQNRCILIQGARQHNLKNISLQLPRDKLIVITGISGSGKSSLAFDTIYAEGQRRYVESLAPYARQFLEQMVKPDVDHIEGLPPTIAIEQRSSSANPRSTVATTTEIYDYLRVLFARVGKPYCYKCGRAIAQQTPQQIVERILEEPAGTKAILLAPIIRGKKGEHREALYGIKRNGFLRARVDGKILDLTEIPALDKNRKHQIDAVVDRVIIRPDLRERLSDSVEAALKFGEGVMVLSVEKEGKWRDIVMSTLYACVYCGISVGEISPRMFSFNSPYGACPTCNGLGTMLELDVDLIVPDRSLSLADGAVEPWKRIGRQMARYYYRVLRQFCREFGVDIYRPFYMLPKEIQRVVLHGTEPADEEKYGASFEGVIPNLERRFRQTESDYVKKKIMEYMSELPCPACDGARLRPEALAVKVGGKSIRQVTAMTIDESLEFFEHLKLDREKRIIAEQVLKEIVSRLTFLVNVGLSYLTLDRRSGTLAGGEAQRIRLATQVGSGLVGVCYVLDEPSVGLHQRDNEKLIGTLRDLRDLGNTVIVVEHDEATIRAADHIVDIGPGAGAHGGYVVTQGDVQTIVGSDGSLTAKYLKGELKIAVPSVRRPVKKNYMLEVKKAREHNLKGIDVKIPLGVFVCVTGVSGSGKSTLIGEILYKALARRLHNAREKPGAHDGLSGVEHIDKVIQIDQSPIGRTPRSNPATYTGAFDEIRKLFAMTKEARIRGYRPGRFSFNVRGGRCEACQGQGTKCIEMHFLPDVHVVCEECKARRYNRATLEIQFKGKNIAEVLDMTVEEALDFFKNFPKLKRILETLYDVGLGYITLGQSSTTLSGGEAQRVKLAAELGRAQTGRTLYILDEPTTGLHFADISRLLEVLNRLVNLGNTVIVIEHNMDVIKMADWVIDLGPEGGEQGGWVIAEGTPEEIMKNNVSYTGKFIAKYLNPTSIT